MRGRAGRAGGPWGTRRQRGAEPRAGEHVCGHHERRASGRGIGGEIELLHHHQSRAESCCRARVRLRVRRRAPRSEAREGRCEEVQGRGIADRAMQRNQLQKQIRVRSQRSPPALLCRHSQHRCRRDPRAPASSAPSPVRASRRRSAPRERFGVRAAGRRGSARRSREERREGVAPQRGLVHQQ